MNDIQSTIISAWESHGKIKHTHHGFISGNAVCCQHNGESIDKRGRGGIKITGDSIGYNCFNCGFKTGWQPGRHLSHKMRQLMTWLHVDDGNIKRLVITAMQLKDIVIDTNMISKDTVINFKLVDLPPKSVLLSDNDVDFINYLKLRGLSRTDYPFYCTTDTVARMHKRIIIPFYWEGEIVGYTGRLINDGSPKYYNQMPLGYVFNVDNQTNREFVIVTEGPMDAISIDCISTLGNTISEKQIDIIDQLGKQIIVVPDSDKSGNLLINTALSCGWDVSFPQWLETCKDTNDAVRKYGKIFTLKNILDNVETSKLKIQIKTKSIHGK